MEIVETERVRRVLVTGNWENLFQGTCNEVGHLRKPEDVISSSILKDLSQFEEFLKDNPKLISIQLASEDKFTFEYHGNLLKLIGDNCSELECLSILLVMEEEECKKQAALDLDKAETNPHAEIWDKFIKNVGPDFQHISFPGDYGIPLFAMKLLFERCPCLDYIDGNYSKECTIMSADEIPTLTKERAESVVFANLYYDRFDLNSIVSQCSQIRTLLFNWRHGKDLMLLEHENMKKLVELEIADRRNLKLDPSVEALEAVEADEIEHLEAAAGDDEALAADLILPFECHLRYLTVDGVLSDETWNLLSKRAPSLQVISYTNAQLLCPSLLHEFLNIFRLRGLILKIPNTLTSEELLPFLEKFIENSRNHFTSVGTSLSISLIEGTDKETVQETVEDVLKCLNSTVVDGEQGPVEVRLQFHEYDESFKFEFSEEMSGIEVDMKKTDSEDNAFDFQIRTSKYFNAQKYPRKLRVIGKRDDTYGMSELEL